MRDWLNGVEGMDLGAAVFVCYACIWENVVKLFSHERNICQHFT